MPDNAETQAVNIMDISPPEPTPKRPLSLDDVTTRRKKYQNIPSVQMEHAGGPSLPPTKTASEIPEIPSQEAETQEGITSKVEVAKRCRSKRPVPTPARTADVPAKIQEKPDAEVLRSKHTKLWGFMADVN